MRFVMLKHRNGEPIYVNPAQVLSVAPVFNDRESGMEDMQIGSAVTTNRGTIITSELCGDVVARLERGMMV